MKIDVFFTVGDKGLKMTVEAQTEHEARMKVLEKIQFLKFEPQHTESFIDNFNRITNNKYRIK